MLQLCPDPSWFPTVLQKKTNHRPACPLPARAQASVQVGEKARVPGAGAGMASLSIPVAGGEKEGPRPRSDTTHLPPLTPAIHRTQPWFHGRISEESQRLIGQQGLVDGVSGLGLGRAAGPGRKQTWVRCGLVSGSRCLSLLAACSWSERVSGTHRALCFLCATCRKSTLPLSPPVSIPASCRDKRGTASSPSSPHRPQGAWGLPLSLLLHKQWDSQPWPRRAPPPGPHSLPDFPPLWATPQSEEEGRLYFSMMTARLASLTCCSSWSSTS